MGQCLQGSPTDAPGAVSNLHGFHSRLNPDPLAFPSSKGTRSVPEGLIAAVNSRPRSHSCRSLRRRAEGETSSSVTEKLGKGKLWHGSGVQGWFCFRSLYDFAAVTVQKYVL